IATLCFRLCGQFSMRPSGVADQSFSRIRRAISPGCLADMKGSTHGNAGYVQRRLAVLQGRDAGLASPRCGATTTFDTSFADPRSFPLLTPTRRSSPVCLMAAQSLADGG